MICQLEGCNNEVVGRSDKRHCSSICKSRNKKQWYIDNEEYLKKYRHDWYLKNREEKIKYAEIHMFEVRMNRLKRQGKPMRW